MVGAKLNYRAGILFWNAYPYLKEKLQRTPQFGTASFTLVFFEGDITNFDVAGYIKSKPCGHGGRP